MKNLIKGIVFDMGGVVATDPTKKIAKWIANVTNIDYLKIFNIITDNKYLLPYQTAVIDHNEFWQSIKKAIGAEFSTDDVETIAIDNLKPNIQVMKLVGILKANYKIGLLTNCERNRFAVWNDRYFSGVFDAIITSFQVKDIKPNNKIYKKMLNILKMLPTEVIFIDDNINNIIGASKLGIDSIHFKSYKQLINNLQYKSIIN